MAIYDITYQPPRGNTVVGTWQLGGFTTAQDLNPGMWYSDQVYSFKPTVPAFYHSSPTTGAFPSSPSGNYTLTYTVLRTVSVDQQLPAGATGLLESLPIVNLPNSGDAGVFRMGTFAQMRAAFGTGNDLINPSTFHQLNDGLWVLTRPGTAAPARITFELADIAAVTPAILPITPPPTPTTTYQNVATWNAAGYPGGSTTTVFAYANASLGLHYSCNVATSGTAPMTQPPAGTYRIRVSGGGSSAAQTGLTGTISHFRAQDGATNQCTVRIGTSSQWGTAFAGVPSSGVVWHLERQTTTTPPATGPSTGATWNAGSGSANQTAIYQANGVLAVNSNAVTGFYNGNIPAGSMWRIRRANDTTTDAPFRPLTNVQTGSNFFVIRVGSNADMTGLFGTSQIQTGAAWVLERSDGTPATAGQRGTTVGSCLCQRGGVLSWERRNAIPRFFDVLTYNDTPPSIGFRQGQ